MGPEQIWLVSYGFLSIFIALVLYMMGGTSGFAGKWLRRFLATFILALSANLIAVFNSVWDWPFVLMWPALIGGMSLGYGADTTWGKIVKRTIFALGTCFAGFFGYWAMGFPGFGLGILIMQVLVGLFSVWLGVKNPYNNAPLEQGIICLLLTFTVPFWAYVK